MNVSGVVLAGGKSSRMKTDKAYLTINGETLLSLQINKFKKLGITDIIVADNLGKGPLSGIAKGLKEAQNDFVLFIPVDCPLIKESELMRLIGSHRASGSQITVFKSEDHIQPLVGIYNKALAKDAKAFIDIGNSSPMQLHDKYTAAALLYNGSAAELMGFNTPDEFEKCKQNLNK